jgi:hypothetical protein
VKEPQRALFPMAVAGEGDVRFAAVMKRLGTVVEEEGFGRMTHEDRVATGAALFGVFYGSGGAAGELEKRLNGTAAPLVAADGSLDSYDCLAVAHELRRNKGAAGALVIAMSSDDELSIGLAAEQGTMMDVVGNELIDALSSVIEKRGWKAPEVKDVGFDFTVADGTGDGS